jgi:hypothetical protein
MLTFIFSFLLFRRLGISKRMRRALLLTIAVLFTIVLVYTANLFLTLEERTSAPHVHTHNAH